MSARQRNKGNAAEVSAAKELCYYAGLTPWRKHIRTSRDLVGGNQQERAGDLIPVSEEAQALLKPFSIIEVKADKSFSFDALMRFGGEVPQTYCLAKWIAKCRRVDPQGVELILLSLPRMPWWAVAPLLGSGATPTMRFRVGEAHYGIWRLDRLVERLRQ